MRLLRFTAILPAMLCVALLPRLCLAQEVIRLVYSERPPYTMQSADAPTGLTGTPTAQAFKAAGIAVEWHNVPTNRQLAMIKDQRSMTCGVGWYWSPERAHFAKYTKPIFRDGDWTVLANAAFAERHINSLADLQQHRDARVLVKDNYTYGPTLDKMLESWKPVVAISAAPTAKMVQSISKGAVDMMFMSTDEADYIMAHAGEQARNLRQLHLKDMPHGLERHIMCGKNVPDEVIARLNKVITFK